MAVKVRTAGSWDPSAGSTVASVNGQTGDVTLDAADVGAPTETEFDTHAADLAIHSSGRVLQRAESSATQTGLTSSTDVTGLSITFTVGSRAVEVTAFLPWVAPSASDTSTILRITDENNTEKSLASGPVGTRGSIICFETISTPGTYTRKARLARGVGTGTVANNASSTTIAKIQAVEQ